MDIIVKLVRCSWWIDDLKSVLISFKLENSSGCQGPSPQPGVGNCPSKTNFQKHVHLSGATTSYNYSPRKYQLIAALPQATALGWSISNIESK